MANQNFRVKTGLEVGTGVTISAGIITATKFVGDGSGLTNISGISTAIQTDGSDINISGKITTNSLVIPPSFSYTEVGILTGSSFTGANYGKSVSLSSDGGTLAIGVPYDQLDISYPGTGLVYVYDRVGVGTTASFNQVGILTGSLAVDGYEYFGFSVVVSSNGNRIVVGAPYDSIDPLVSNGGLAYVFDRVGVGTTAFKQVGILTGSYATDISANFDYFGSSVDISSNNNTIVVGAYSDEIDPNIAADTGLVYVFDSVGFGTTSTFTQVGVLTGLIDPYYGATYFGKSTKISDDGKTIVVGAFRSSLDPLVLQQTGLVYVYDRVGVGTTSSFVQVGILTAGDNSNVNDAFGDAVEISSDARTIIVGAPGDEKPPSTNSGLVYVFDRVGVGTTSSFIQVGVIEGLYSPTVYATNFGSALATNSDGTMIAVGSYDEEVPSSATTGIGFVYLYKRTGNKISRVGILTGSLSSDTDDNFGNSLAMSVDGNYLVVGAKNDEISGNTDTGVVYVFSQTNSTYNMDGDTKLFVSGDARIGLDPSHGVILTSPGGNQYRLKVDDSGTLSTVLVS